VTDEYRFSLPQWNNSPLKLFHGTDERSIESLLGTGIDLQFSRDELDFGRGFYVTTSLAQAMSWAEQKVDYKQESGGLARVMEFAVSRDYLAELESLWFVRGTAEAVDFWSFVTHCRSSERFHGRDNWYDIVIGPVTRNFRKRTLLEAESDQISFHTDRALKLLDPKKAEVISW
jgi:hypothetical protein